MPLLDVRPDHLEWVKKILAEQVPQADVWAFGSRAKWLAKDTSDLDLCVDAKQPLSFVQIGLLKEAFENSDLPYKVDIVDWATTSESFRKIIERDRVAVQRAGERVSSKWRQVSLKEVTSVLGDGLHGTPKYDPNGDHFFINGNNLSNGKIIFNDTTKRVSSVEAAKYQKNLTDRTILVSINGTLGNVAFYAGEKVILGKSACYFNVLESIDKHFIRYILDSEIFQGYIQNLATGSTIKNVSLKLMRDFQFSLPPLVLQQRISAILSALDDRITLLRETNATLEAIAQALFKSWFVDFDPVRAKLEGRAPEGMDEATARLFPDSFEESELGLVPRGWRVESVYTVSTLIYGAPFASKQFNSNRDGAPLIRIRDLRDEAPGVFTPEVHPKGYMVQPGDIVVGMDGEFRAYLWGGEPAWLNQRVCVVAPKAGCPAAFVHRAIMPLLAAVEASETATTVIHLGKNDIDRFRILVPDARVLAAFGKLTDGLYSKIVNSKQSARTLATLRDTLLPRLISGALRLPEARALTERISL